MHAGHIATIIATPAGEDCCPLYTLQHSGTALSSRMTAFLSVASRQFISMPSCLPWDQSPLRQL